MCWGVFLKEKQTSRYHKKERFSCFCLLCQYVWHWEVRLWVKWRSVHFQHQTGINSPNVSHASQACICQERRRGSETFSALCDSIPWYGESSGSRRKNEGKKQRQRGKRSAIKPLRRNIICQGGSLLCCSPTSSRLPFGLWDDISPKHPYHLDGKHRGSWQQTHPSGLEQAWARIPVRLWRDGWNWVRSRKTPHRWCKTWMTKLVAARERPYDAGASGAGA